MSPSSDRVPSPIDSDARFAVGAPSSMTPVAIALVAIVGAGLIGLYRGVISVREQVAGAAASPSAGAIVGATPAVPLPTNPNWSTLSGPQVLPPPVAKAPKAEDDNDSADDSGTEPSQAAQAMAPDAGADTTPSPAAAPAAAPPTAPQRG